MKILVFSQYYYPEPFKIHEICEELVRRGNEVTVITGLPNYPEGKIYDGYDCKSEEMLNGVHVIRTNITPRGNNYLSLIRNYISYPIKATQAIKKLKKQYDIAFVYQLSPVFVIVPAINYKKKYHKKVYNYCLDLWPESIKVLHIKESNPFFYILKQYCNKLYQKCDFISVTSPAFIEYLSKVNKVEENKINHISQHGEDFFLKVDTYKKQPKLNITFAGNIGKAQDLSCVVKAVACIPKGYLNKLQVTIIGSGSYENELKKIVKESELQNIFVFEGRKRIEELIYYYDNTSLFLLSLEKDSLIGKTIPTKLQTYMSAGRGIIGSVDGATAEIINDAKCGKICKAGDYQNLSEIIIEMIEADDIYLQKLAQNSRNYFKLNFSLEKHVDEILNKMEELVK